MHAEEWCLEHWGTYQKQSLANRCKITGANGPVTLSVPLIAGREQKTLLQQVQIDNTQRWQVQHLRTIKSCYGRAPFFEYYFPTIESLLTPSCIYLTDLDNIIIRQVLQWLNINPHIKKTGIFESAAAYQIPVFVHLKPYVQVFSDRTGFLPGLSILDGLFCAGPQIAGYLGT